MARQLMAGRMPPRLFLRENVQINQLLRLAVIPGQLLQTFASAQKVYAAVAYVCKCRLIA